MSTLRADRLVTLLIAVWAGLFVWSFIGFTITEPTGDGFTRGLNRISGFLLWQLAAGIVAAPAYIAGRALPRGSGMRWLSRVPLALAVALVLAIVGVILWARFSG